MASAEPFPNQDFLGRCYDIVTLDPLDLTSSAKYENAIDIQATDGTTVVTRDGKFLVPLGVDHKGIYSMSWESQSRLISSSYEFQQEFMIAVEADAGVDGVFEFSGSASRKEVSRITESRKSTFVYSRAYKQNHGLELELAETDAPIKLTTSFTNAAKRLPVGEFSTVRGAYDQFLDRFGTHFTTQIILGGLAFQRTTGAASTWLSSREKEEQLKAKASVQVDTIKGGASTEVAQKKASTVDSESKLDRTSLEFRGGTGSPTGIDDAWIESLDDKPAVVKAKLAKLSALLTSRFFPDVPDIEARQELLECAIYTWVKTKGTPGSDKQPLQYGERFALCFIYTGQTVPTAARLWPGASPVKSALSVPPLGQNVDAPIAFVTLERAAGRDEGTILAGDEVRVRVPGTKLLLEHGGHTFSETASGDTTWTILHHPDDPAKPTRLGEYFLEKDEIQLSPSTPGRTGWRAFFNTTQGGTLNIIAVTPGSSYEKLSALTFRRAGVDAPEVG